MLKEEAPEVDRHGEAVLQDNAPGDPLLERSAAALSEKSSTLRLTSDFSTAQPGGGWKTKQKSLSAI